MPDRTPTVLAAHRAERIAVRAVEEALEAIGDHLDQLANEGVSEDVLDTLNREMRTEHAARLARTITTRLWHSGCITPTPEGGDADA